MNFTRAQLPDVIRKAYDLSRPQGMGHLHYAPGPLRQDIVESLLETGAKYGSIHLDYVLGRAVKLVLVRDKENVGTWHITDADSWYDHSSDSWDELRLYIKELNNVAPV